MSSEFRDTEQFRDVKWGGDQLRSISFFGDLTSNELQELYSRGEIKHLSAQSHAVIEGEPTRGLYIILSGTVSVYKNDSTKSKMIRLTHLESGSFFGELSLFDDAPRSATVVAESSCYVFHLSFEAFSLYLDSKGDGLKARFYKTCSEEMVKRFRRQNSDYLVAQEQLWKYALDRSGPAAESSAETP